MDPIYYRCINLLSNLSLNINIYIYISYARLSSIAGVDVSRNRTSRAARTSHANQRGVEGGEGEGDARASSAVHRRQRAKNRRDGFSRQIDRMDRTRDCDARYGVRLPRPPSSRGILRRVPRPVSRGGREKTSCGPGSIFRVRRCNKKQSSQRGVDRRWRPRRVVDDRLSRPYLAPVSLFIPRVRLYRHDWRIGICISNFAARRTRLFPSA